MRADGPDILHGQEDDIVTSMGRTALLALGMMVSTAVLVIVICLRPEMLPTEDGREYALNRWTGTITEHTRADER